MGVGKYDRELVWLKRSIVKNNLGEDVETFTSQGSLWGSVKELAATRQLAYGVQNSSATLEIRLHQWPAVDAKDRLLDSKFNMYLIIDGLVPNSDNETVVYAHKEVNP